MQDTEQNTQPPISPPSDLVAQIKATAIMEAEVLREQLRGWVEEGV